MTNSAEGKETLPSGDSELFIGSGLIRNLAGLSAIPENPAEYDLARIKDCRRLDDNDALVGHSDFDMIDRSKVSKRPITAAVSLNDNVIINNRKSFDPFKRPDPDDFFTEQPDILYVSKRA